MGHKNPGRFFNDPTAVNPQTGQLLYPPPAPPTPPPDPRVLALQAKAQADQLAVAHRAQVEQQKAQADAIHQKLKAEAEIELAKIKAELDAQIKVFDAHLQAATEARKSERSHVPGARRAMDGHHYVPDPKRPGKFLMVVHHV